jgi:hypothetical protein
MRAAAADSRRSSNTPTTTQGLAALSAGSLLRLNLMVMEYPQKKKVVAARGRYT